MKKKTPTEPVLQIIPVTDAAGVETVRVKYKGKFLHPETVDGVEEELKIYRNAEDFLDFDAGILSDKAYIILNFTEPIFSGLLDGMLVEWKANRTKITYDFLICLEEWPAMDLNPVVILDRMITLAKKEGVAVKADEDDLSYSFYFYAKPGDNLLKLYRQHIRLLERLWARAEKEMIKRILQAQQSKKK